MDGLDKDDIHSVMKDEKVVHNKAQFAARVAAHDDYIMKIEDLMSLREGDISVTSFEYINKMIKELVDTAEDFTEKERATKLATEFRWKFGKEVEDFMVSLKGLTTEAVLEMFTKVIAQLAGRDKALARMEAVLGADDDSDKEE